LPPIPRTDGPAIFAAAAALLALLFLAPGSGRGQSANARTFGDFVLRYSAISTAQLPPSMLRKYSIERSDRHGLLNIAVEQKSDHSRMVHADVSAIVTDLFGQSVPVRFIETDEAGQIDYLGTFPLNGSGNYRFDVKVIAPGRTRAFELTFNRDYIVD